MQVNLAIRWFAGFGLTERLPDHSLLPTIRQRWSEGLLRMIFTRVVQDCQRKELVAGDVVLMDASLTQADVSFDSLVAQHLDAVVDEDPDTEERLARSSGEYKKRCATGPRCDDGDLVGGQAFATELQAAYRSGRPCRHCRRCGDRYGQGA